MDRDLLWLDGRVFGSKRFEPSEEIPIVVLDSPWTVCVVCMMLCYCHE